MTSPAEAQTQIAQTARHILDKTYGLGTVWEAPNENGQQGFARAQAETHGSTGEYLDAHHIRVLIETAIYCDRRLNGPSLLDESDQLSADQQITVPAELLVYFADLARTHLFEKLQKFEHIDADEQARMEAHRDFQQLLWARELLRPVL